MPMNSGHVTIIAEAGVNHNGSLEMATRLVQAAAEAGADAVKFQTFRADAIVTRSAAKADYQVQTTGAAESQHEMLRRLELDEAAHVELMKVCQACSIAFLSTAFDFQSLDLLIRLGVDVWKVPSGEVTNLPYLRRIGALKQKVILSTGMCTLPEIHAAREVLVRSGTRADQVTILHCTTEYPAPYEDVNLRVLRTLSEAFPESPVGYSDHTQGIEVSLAAAALGATVIEKHFTLDRNLPGPDHRASLESGELKALVQGIRNISLALGSPVKQPSAGELKNREVARKSLVARCGIRQGEEFTAENLDVKRPGTGVCPMRWDEIIGTKAARDYRPDELIDA
jgi:N,N'-diacetyllegionaminate synthase